MGAGGKKLGLALERRDQLGLGESLGWLAEGLGSLATELDQSLSVPFAGGCFRRPVITLAPFSPQ